MKVVALRKESVDRNPNGNSGLLLVRKSLSARRAWIEIYALRPGRCATRVALRKESVDRNVGQVRAARFLFRSLSARRAWIEIFVMYH